MPAAIQVHRLRKIYGDLTAVDDVCFAVEEGEFFGILGPNGAGKTTTLEMIEGLRRPDAGQVTLLGENPWPRNASLLPRIGVQLQASSFFERLTAREQIRTFASLYGVPAAHADEWLARVGLEEKAGTRTEKLSGGQKQRLAIASALVHDPEVVFLDEPTAALDPQARRNLWDLLGTLNESGRTVVLTTHYMDEAEALCDRVAIVDHGRLLQLDTPSALVRGLDADVRIYVDAALLKADDAASIPGVAEVDSDGDSIVVAHQGPVRRTLGARRTPRARRAAGEGSDAGGRVPDAHRTGVPPMTAFWSLSIAIFKGFFRDRQSVFFAIVFPLMFLVLFGGVFDFGTSKLNLVEVGDVALVHQLPGPAQDAFEESFEVTTSDDLDEAVTKVAEGDADAAIEMRGNTFVAHYSQADQVKAAMTQGTLRAFVDAANVAASGQPPRFAFQADQVEDESLDAIQFVTPGLLGWAVAMSAAFGAAATLQGWRQSKLLRRLRLSPASTGQIVAARIVVAVVIALVQMGIFVGLATLAFGMQLTGFWWMSVPLLVAGTLAFMSLGLLAGALAGSTEGAVNLANFFVLPMAFLSGSFFPLESAPDWLQTVSLLMPLRHLNDAMTDVMVRGLGPSATGTTFVVLLGFAVVVSVIAARLFRWDVD